MTHPHPKRSFIPQAVLTKSGKLCTAGAAVNTVRLVNTANTKAVNTIRSVNNAALKSIVNHPRTKKCFQKRIFTKVKHTTARDRAVVSENKGKGANVVKASACWVWKAKNSRQPTTEGVQRKRVIDSGCSRHMTGNKCYLNEYEDYDGGFVSFGDGKSKEVRTSRYLSLVVPLKKVGDEAVHKELGDRMERAATTSSSLEAEQDNGSGPRCQDTIVGDVDAQTRFETTSKQSNDLPLSKVNTFGSGDDKSDGFAEIIDFLKASSVHYALTINPIIYASCIQQFWVTSNVKMVNRVRQLQALIDKKKMIIMESSIRSDLHLEDAEGLKRLKKVGAARRIESSNDSLGAQEDASKQGRRIKDIDADAEVTLVNKTQERQDQDLMFDTRVLDGDEMFVDATTGEKDEQITKINDSTIGEAVTTAGVDDSAAGEAVTTAGVEDSVAPTIPTIVEETLAQTLMEIKAAKPKAKGIFFHDLEKQPERPLTKKDQVSIDEDLARNIQAQLDTEIIEEERLERKKQEEANIALIET
ncbi:hypothetical protein Tco_0183696 [Tanacetum coccineum]